MANSDHPKNKRMKIKFLGTGANGGIPQVDCKCINCSLASTKPEYQRLRSSILVKTSKGNMILDCGPDFRQQILKENLRLKDISLIAITHLHFDHAGGLIELSAGEKLCIPVLLSSKTRKPEIIKSKMPSLIYLQSAGFIKMVSEEDTESLGVELISVLHDPNFPTSAIVVNDKGKSMWYSPDVFKITRVMVDKMRQLDLVIFDGTFLNEEIWDASAYYHVTIKDSAPELADVNQNVIFSHINHTESSQRARDFLERFNFTLAEDGQEERL